MWVRPVSLRRASSIFACLVALAISFAPARRAGAAPAATAPALSPEQAAKAKALYTQAIGYYNAHQWGPAIAALKDCYQISPQPILMFDIAQAYREDGSDELALRYYQEFLIEAPKTDPNRPQADVMIEDIERKIGQEGAASKPATSKAAAPSSVPRRSQAPAVPAGVVRLPARPAAVETAPWYEDKLAMGLLGGGALVALAGGGLFLYAAHLQSSASSLSERNSYDQIDRAWTTSEIAAGCEIAGGLAVAGGIVRLVLVHGGHVETGTESERSTSLRLGPAGLSLQGTF